MSSAADSAIAQRSDADLALEFGSRANWTEPALGLVSPSSGGRTLSLGRS
jgi:hypothetical protein